MGMKEPKHEPQGKLCGSLSTPGPQDTGAHLPMANLVSASKDTEESVKSLAPNLIAITGGAETRNPG